MSYREKAAWLALIASILTFGPYFTAAGMDLLPEHTLQRLGVYATAMLVQVVILVIGQLWMRWQTPDEARAPADERDLAVLYKARTLAYYVLLSGFIWVGAIMPFGATGWRVVHAALFMIATAEAVHNAAMIYYYRRMS